MRLPSFSRWVIRKVASRLRSIPFRLQYWDGTYDTFGSAPPEFEIAFRRHSAVRKILMAPDPAFGEAYISGDLDIQGLPRFLDAYLTSPDLALPRWVPRWKSPRVSVSQQYADVQSHYDRSNAFFALWLDPSRSYSCAYFRHPFDSLEKAQAAKIDYVLRKAQLRLGQRLLDIGSGWGALILEAAKRYSVFSHGITVSRQQYEYTMRRIASEGLQDRVRVELLDYRELARRKVQYDRIISVGMMEHVGERNLPVFLECLKSMLVPGGVGVLHSMMRIEEKPVSAYIRRHVFPGSYVPSWREVVSLLPEFDFHLLDMESLRRHYAITLERWAGRFEACRDEVRALGFDEPFIRMWRLYLHSCAASFRAGVLDLDQIVFTHGVNNDLAFTREHLYSEKISKEEGTTPCEEAVVEMSASPTP